jgi:hypothetical protein
LAYFVSCRGGEWSELLSKLFGDAPRVLAQVAPPDAARALAGFGRICLDAGLTAVVELRDTSNAQHAAVAHEMRQALRSTRVYQALSGTLVDERCELAAIFVLAAPSDLWDGLSAEPRAELLTWIEEARGLSSLEPEIAHVRTQIEELRSVLAIQW